VVYDGFSAPSKREKNAVLAANDPPDLVKLQILQDRLQLSAAETLGMLESLRDEVARQLSVPSSGVAFDAEFNGREMDLTFTIDIQNLPAARKRS